MNFLHDNLNPYPFFLKITAEFQIDQLQQHIFKKKPT